MVGGDAYMSKASGVIVAKAKAMHGEAFTGEQYDELLRKKSVAEITRYLKNETGYGEALKDVRENNIHRGQLEDILKRDMFQKILKLYRYADTSTRALYQLYLEQLEIDLILSRVRVLISQDFESAIAELPLFLKDLTSFSLVRLGNVHTYEELVSVMESTPYYRVLLLYRVPKGQEDTINYTEIETSLQKQYYAHVFEVIAKTTKGKSKKRLMDFFTMRLDLSNITKIYRLKKYFQAKEEVIKESLIFVEGYQSFIDLEELIAQRSAQEALKILQSSKYKITLTQSESDYIEHYCEEIIFHHAKKKFQYSQDTPLVYNSYIVLLAQELENIINIIEGVRYLVDSEDIQKELIY